MFSSSSALALVALVVGTQAASLPALIPGQVTNVTSSILNSTGIISVASAASPGKVYGYLSSNLIGGFYGITQDKTAAVAVTLPSALCSLLPPNFSITGPAKTSSKAAPYVGLGGPGANPSAEFALQVLGTANAAGTPQQTANSIDPSFSSESAIWTIADCTTRVLSAGWTDQKNVASASLVPYQDSTTYSYSFAQNGATYYSYSNSFTTPSIKLTNNYPAIVTAGNKVIDSTNTNSVYYRYIVEIIEYFYGYYYYGYGSFYEYYSSTSSSSSNTYHWTVTTSTEQLVFTYIPNTASVPFA